jgi:hypothetical protein
VASTPIYTGPDHHNQTRIGVYSFISCRCRKLPKALKDWPAFEELRKKIDDFNEMVPLLELMANKSMKTRHWKRMEALTGANFDMESDNFTLRNILEAPLLKYKEDIEVSIRAILFKFNVIIL